MAAQSPSRTRSETGRKTSRGQIGPAWLNSALAWALRHGDELLHGGAHRGGCDARSGGGFSGARRGTGCPISRLKIAGGLVRHTRRKATSDSSQRRKGTCIDSRRRCGTEGRATTRLQESWAMGVRASQAMIPDPIGSVWNCLLLPSWAVRWRSQEVRDDSTGVSSPWKSPVVRRKKRDGLLRWLGAERGGW